MPAKLPWKGKPQDRRTFCAVLSHVSGQPLQHPVFLMIMLPIVPHAGIGTLRLEASRAAIRAAAAALGLTPSSTHEESDYFAEESVQVEYDAAGKAQFIGVSPLVNVYRATFDGADVSDTEAGALFRKVAEAEGGTHVFEPDGYLFPRQIVLLWAADRENDQLRSGPAARLIWGQVGVGTPAYRATVEKIRARDT